MRQNCGEEYTFQQDGARAHTARETVAYLEQNVPDFIEPTLGPPNSPDINPMDYSIWGALEQIVYARNIVDVDDLKRAISRGWAHLGQRAIDGAIYAWRGRVQKMVAMDGGHIEQFYD